MLVRHSNRRSQTLSVTSRPEAPWHGQACTEASTGTPGATFNVIRGYYHRIRRRWHTEMRLNMLESDEEDNSRRGGEETKMRTSNSDEIRCIASTTSPWPWKRKFNLSESLGLACNASLGNPRKRSSLTEPSRLACWITEISRRPSQGTVRLKSLLGSGHRIFLRRGECLGTQVRQRPGRQDILMRSPHDKSLKISVSSARAYAWMMLSYIPVNSSRGARRICHGFAAPASGVCLCHAPQKQERFSRCGVANCFFLVPFPLPDKKAGSRTGRGKCTARCGPCSRDLPS